jgi:tetratricopeptide (TPR) repeat protein
MQWAPMLFLPAPLGSRLIRSARDGTYAPAFPATSFAEKRFSPVYPSSSPLDGVLRLAAPGTDEYVLEGYAAQIADLLNAWSHDLRSQPRVIASLGKLLSSSIQFTSLTAAHESALRPGNPVEVFRREYSSSLDSGKEHFLHQIEKYCSSLEPIEVADFEIYACSQLSESPLTIEARIRYDFVGTQGKLREERIGNWNTQWSRSDSGQWQARKWIASEENVSRATGPVFFDITGHALGQTNSYREQLLHGADYWRTVLDGAVGVDVYGNTGVAVGDFNNDGFDDVYICQPAGLPNRLYRNRGDGTFADVTETAGVGVLDFTACALFADFQNRGLQDLLVVSATGPLLFLNNGNGTFSLKKDAFRFERTPQGSFTHAAVADHDRDGRLDIYFCLYSYYQGLDQYHYPIPYFDARNGPPNYLFHNEGNGVFQDRTQAAGLDAENDRYSFACSWGDCDGNGWPDLYVVNDFGRNNLYRNNGDGTFTAVSHDAQVDEAGAGMSACWLDFDNAGKQDIYAAGMWVAAGMRVFGDAHFHAGEPDAIRSIYRRHMAGNSLYRNQGKFKFQNVAVNAGVEMGRWSWSTDSWDFDHDGYADLYVANGYISGLEQRDVSSFFWRQVVARSPQDSTPAPDYERGWNAMNELIRSDATWNGLERNVFFANNRDGRFSDVSGLVGLDFRDDSRAFALADLDGDGRLEIVLKNRSAPQVRILRNAMSGLGDCLAFRLRGQQSNRDAIGSAVTVEAGSLRQTKYLQAGSGFLSQHTKELFFGLGKNEGTIRATIRWPNGLTQTFDNLPINSRLEIVEGEAKCVAKPFAQSPKSWSTPAEVCTGDAPPSAVATWLIEPVEAADLSLPDTAGNLRDLRSLLGGYLLLNFWISDSSACRDQLQSLGKAWPTLSANGLRIAAMNFDDPSDLPKIRSIAQSLRISFPVLLASQEVAGTYNLLFRYMFDRHKDLPLPSSFLLDGEGKIVRVYQGKVAADQVLQDILSAPKTPEDRFRKALPFPGTLHQGSLQRNAFTYGVALFQHGFLQQAERSFQQGIAAKPDEAEAYYNLGTLYLRQNSLLEAKQYLEQTVKLRPDHPEAWNNLGMVAAQQGDNQEAIRCFQQSLSLRPGYATALLNLGNLYRRQGDLDRAENYLQQAVTGEPKNAEVNYGLGMLYARKNQPERAEQYLNIAISLRPDYADALNNLGVLLVQQQRYPEAEKKFKTCIAQIPTFDQAYLNLARLYIVLNRNQDARAVLQSLLQKQPEHKMAQQMLQML